MPALNFAPGLSYLAAWGVAPLRPLHVLLRNTEEKLRPPRIAPHASRLASAAVGSPADGAATVLREPGAGRVPTIVLGGLVPDATEQAFLLRRFLLKSGDVFYVQYPRDSFSLDRLCAQLDDLVDELARAGRPPVILAVSFGAGVVLEWLQRARRLDREPALAGLVLVSPVACGADLLGVAGGKPATLLGRALRPYVDSATPPTDATVERSRAVFVRMFEAGAQNKLALRLLMTPAESERLRSAVIATIRGVTPRGAQERVRALLAMQPPTAYFSPQLLPLSRVPTLILFAEREEAVLDPGAPVRLALEQAVHAYFPGARVRRVKARPGGAPVQHASLVFHVFEFMAPLRAFYRRLRRDALALAA